MSLESYIWDANISTDLGWDWHGSSLVEYMPYPILYFIRNVRKLFIFESVLIENSTDSDKITHPDQRLSGRIDGKLPCIRTTDLDPKVLHMCEWSDTDYQTTMLKMYKEFFVIS